MRAVGLALLISCISSISGLEIKYGLDEVIKYECVDDSTDINDICDLYEECTSHNYEAHCKEQIVLAVFKDNKFYAQAFGVPIGEKYVLTTVSSGVAKYHTGEEWVALHNGHGYQLTTKTVRPLVKFGRYDLTAWHDLAVFEMSQNGNFYYKTSIRELNPDEIPWTVETAINGKGVRYDQILILTDAECTEAFKNEEPHYNKEVMYCARDIYFTEANFKNTLRTVGAGVVVDSDRKIVGLKSLYSTKSSYFLIVKVAKFCGWLKEVTNNAADC